MIGTVPGLAPITTPGRLIIWFCLSLLHSFPESLAEHEYINKFTPCESDHIFCLVVKKTKLI